MTEVFLRRLTPSLTHFVKHQQDYRIISIHRPLHELEKALRELAPAGLITEWVPETTDALLALELDIPTVIVNSDFKYPQYSKVHSIDVDDWAVGREAAQALHQGGFQSFACLGNGLPYSDQRIESFCQTLQDLGIDSPCPTHQEKVFAAQRYSESFTKPSRAFQKWIHDLPKPVGVFAVHDPLGRFLCSTCEEIGINIPDQVSVIGANNDALVCALTYPMLSSVSIPWDALGTIVGQSMQSLILNKLPTPKKTALIPPSGVVLRHSANLLAIQDPLLRRCMSYLNERMQSPISIGLMCSELRIARRSLERKFKEHYRCTPWEMFCQLRVNQAKRLLIETNHSISTISDLCGFNDPERFAVVFKRVSHSSPSSFRKNNR